MFTNASATVPAFAPARLTMARELAGWSKPRLAKAIGLSVASVTHYELGHSCPGREALARCARELDLPVAFFTGGRPHLRLDTAQVHFRSLRSTGAGQRRQALANVELLWEVVEALDRIVELPPVDLGLPVGVPHGRPEHAARAVRRAWRLAAGPVVHLVRNLEARGAVVTELPAGCAEITDAFSSAPHGRPMIALAARGNPMRRRFSVAHELGHLLLHPDPVPGSARHERQANAFAAEFLMPAAELRDRLPASADLAELKHLADGYGVCASALVRRGRDLGVYAEPVVRRTVQTINRLGWRTHEPVRSSYPGERPALLVHAADLAAGHGLTHAQLADRLRIGLPRLRGLIGLPDTRPALRLVHGLERTATA